MNEMSNIKNVCDVLKLLEENEIEYAILRDYIPIENINVSLDVDVYIPIKYKEKVRKFFKNLGWYRQKINCSRYPHEQYIYVLDGAVKKIDIVYDFYYSNKLLKANFEDVLNDINEYDGVKVLGLKNTMITLLLHIIFDKEVLSEKNSKVLKKVYDEIIKENVEIDDIYLNISEELLAGDLDKKSLKKYQKILIDKVGLKHSFIREMYFGVRIKVNNYIRYVIKAVKKKNICIVGIDGTGKSTTTEKIEKILDDKCQIVYMGFKDFKTKKAQKFANKKEKSKIQIFFSIISYYFDMLKRYMDVRFKQKVIIFDRYPIEAYLNYKGIAKVIAFIQYRILFPRPLKTYYLYCDSETSLSRKDDIDNVEEFVKMKGRFDNYFLSSKKIKSFNTDDMNIDEVISEIIEDMNIEYLKYLI